MSEPATPAARTRAKWLNSTVLGIGMASLWSDVGHEMATAAMPALLASLGATSAALGLIEGLSDLAAGLVKLVSGVYADRLERRKPLAVAGYVITAAGMASFALATRSWHVLLGRVGGWIARGARSPAKSVLLTEATTPETRGRAFGLERSMDSLGAVIGPVLAIVLVKAIGTRATFAVTLIPGMLAAICFAALVKEKPHTPVHRKGFWTGVRELPKGYGRFLAGVGIAGMGDFSNTLMILWATQAWAPTMGVVAASQRAMALYVGYNLVYTASCSLAGHLADSFPKHRVLAFGCALAVVPAAALMMPGVSLTKFAVAFGAAGLYMGFWETVESGTAATLLSASVRGTGFGVLATVNGVGDFVSSSLVGVLWVLSPVAAMSLVITTSVIGAGIVGTTPVRDAESEA